MPGSVLVIPMSATAGVLNLQALFAQAPTQANYTAFSEAINGVQGMRVCVHCPTASTSWGFILGKALADVTGANAPVLATTATLSAAGIVTSNPAGQCFQAEAGFDPFEFEVTQTQDFFMGFVASGASTLEIYACGVLPLQSS